MRYTLWALPAIRHFSHASIMHRLSCSTARSGRRWIRNACRDLLLEILAVQVRPIKRTGLGTRRGCPLYPGGCPGDV